MAAKKKRGGWIAGAIRKPGALRKAAAKAGKSTAEFAREHAHSPGKLGRRSRLAITLRKMSRGRKRGGMRRTRR